MIRQVKPLLGTFVEIGIYKQVNFDADDYSRIFQQAFTEVQEIHQQLSFQNPHSELSKLNGAHNRWVTLKPHSVIVLRLARLLTRKSHQQFNCTIGGAMVMKNVLPKLVQHEFLARGVAEDIEIKGRKVRLRKPLLITLDGIAKGYAVDIAVKRLIKEKIAGGWVNAGGDIRVFGESSLNLRQRNNGELSYAKKFQNISVASSCVSANNTPEFPSLLLDGADASELVNSNNDSKHIVSVSSNSTWLADALTKVAATQFSECRIKVECIDLLKALGGQCVKFII